MLKIKRFSVAYTVPKSCPDVSNLKETLDGIVRRDLCQALDARLQRSNAARDDSIWIIRSLHMEIDIDARMSSDYISRQWANEIAHSFERKLDEGSADVMHFRSQADLIARYVIETASGSAAGKWYFRSFEGLAVLQPSAAIRTVLARDADEGMKAASLLSDQEWLTVSSALTEGDAELILRAWNSTVAAPPSPARIWQVWQGHFFTTPADSHEARTALRLVGAALQEDKNAPEVQAAIALTRITCLFRDTDPAAVPSIIKGLSSDDKAWKGFTDSLLQNVANSIQQPRTERALTPFGGLFLLLPLIAELPLEELAAELGGKDTAMLRVLSAMKCFGSHRGNQFLADPLVRTLLRSPDSISVEHVTQYLEGCSERIDRAEAALSRWLRDEGYANGYSVTASAPNRKMQAVVDLQRGMWMGFNDDVGPQQPDSTIPKEQLDRLLAIDAELEYLDFAPEFGAPNRVNLFFSRIANVLLRNLAWRLPGFYASSIPYVNSNFLNMHSSVDRRDGVFDVKLSRPPLHVVLNIAGMLQREYEVPWLRERVVLSAVAE
jgi:hypothetical protein